MKLNAEFEKNAWQEFTLHRLIAGPTIIGIIMLILDMPRFNHESLSMAAFIIFALVTTIWGAKLAAESINDEINQKTWDFIKISSVKPSSLVFGKVFGATSYNWFLGLICISLFLVFYQFNDMKTDGASIFADKPVLFALYAVLTTAFTYFLAFLISVKSLNTNRPKAKRGSIGPMFIALLCSYQIFGFTIFTLADFHYDFYWYTLKVRSLEYSFLLAFMFLFWSIVGAISVTRAELGYKVSNLSWMAFIIFLTFYGNGFIDGLGNKDFNFFEDYTTANSVSGIGCSIAISFFYVNLLTEKKDIITIKKIISQFRKGDIAGINSVFPLWVPSYFLFLVFAVFSIVSTQEPKLAVFIGSLVLLSIRDLLIVVFFNLANKKRADVTAIFYLLVLYVLLPLLFKESDDETLKFFLPTPMASGISLAFMGLQVAGIAFLTSRRINNLTKLQKN